MSAPVMKGKGEGIPKAMRGPFENSEQALKSVSHSKTEPAKSEVKAATRNSSQYLNYRQLIQAWRERSITSWQFEDPVFQSTILQEHRNNTEYHTWKPSIVR